MSKYISIKKNMFKTKTSFIILLVGLAITFASCKKDDNAEPENKIGDPFGAKHLLVKIVPLNGSAFEIAYDGENRVISEKEGDFQAEFAYDSNGKLKIALSLDGNSSIRNDYEWSEDGKLIIIIKYANGIPEMKSVQELDEDGQPKKTTEFRLNGDNWVESGYTTYKWANGNLTSYEYWTYISDQGQVNLELFYSMSYEYDTKINPLRHMTTVTFNGNYTMYMASTNNCILATYTQNDVSSEEFRYSFEYNDDDYPSNYQRQLTSGSQVTTETGNYMYNN